MAGIFGLGIGELILLVIILVILFQPGRVKEIARNIGSALKEFKKGLKEVEKEEKNLKRELE